jgi:aryl-alcohol dehydrogenase-like predicted oxidoreductase
LKNPAVTAAIVGIRSAQQAKGIAGAGDIDLAAAEITEIEHQLSPAAA